MPGPSDYGDVERKLMTPELVDAILDGQTPAGNPAVERLAAILSDLRAELLVDPADDVARRHVDAMAAAMADDSDRPVAFERKLEAPETAVTSIELSRKVPTTLERKGSTELASSGSVTRLERKTSRSFPARRRLVGSAAVASVLLTGGLAAAGELPAPAQAAVSKVVSFVGIHVPDGHDASKNHGSDVSGVAHDPGLTGCEKGAAVSAAASSNAADHRSSDGNGHSCGANGGNAGASGEGQGHGDARDDADGNEGIGDDGHGNAGGNGHAYGAGGNPAHGVGSGQTGQHAHGGGSSGNGGNGGAGGSGPDHGQGSGGATGGNGHAGGSGGHQGQGGGAPADPGGQGSGGSDGSHVGGSQGAGDSGDPGKADPPAAGDGKLSGAGSGNA
jgi:hypothetical protein